MSRIQYGNNEHNNYKTVMYVCNDYIFTECFFHINQSEIHNLHYFKCKPSFIFQQPRYSCIQRAYNLVPHIRLQIYVHAMNKYYLNALSIHQTYLQ